MEIRIEYTDINDQPYVNEIAPESYFEEGEVEIDGVPKYLMIEEYVDQTIDQLKHVKVVIEDNTLKKKRVFSKQFLDGENNVICYNEYTNDLTVEQEVISTILISNSPKTFFYSRVEIQNGIPQLNYKELIRHNKKGEEEYIKI